MSSTPETIENNPPVAPVAPVVPIESDAKNESEKETKHFKLAITRKKGPVAYTYVAEQDLAKMCEKYDNDNEVLDYKIYEATVRPAIAHKPRPNESKRESETIVPDSPQHFSKPYSVDQIDQRDKKQIWNFARTILKDPAETHFPLVPDMTYEQLVACVEFHKAQFQMALDEMVQAKRSLSAKAVAAIREEPEKLKTAKSRSIDAKVKRVVGTGSHVEISKVAKEVSQVAQSPAHKRLLKTIVTMGIDIPNMTRMTEKELLEAFKIAVGNK